MLLEETTLVAPNGWRPGQWPPPPTFALKVTRTPVGARSRRSGVSASHALLRSLVNRDLVCCSAFLARCPGCPRPRPQRAGGARQADPAAGPPRAKKQGTKEQHGHTAPPHFQLLLVGVLERPLITSVGFISRNKHSACFGGHINSTDKTS